MKLFTGIMIFSLVGLVSCGEQMESNSTTFSSGGSKEKKSEEQLAAEAIAADKAETGDAVGAAGPLTEKMRTVKEVETGKTDILFVLDNSGSMTNEVTNVSNNLLAFFNKMKESTDTRVGIISSIANSAGSTALYIPKEIRPEVIVHEQTVNSIDAPDRVMEYLNGPGKYFFRNESSKIIIAVTDDNARNVGAYIGADGPAKFEEDLFKIINKEDFKMYGFAANETTMTRIGVDGCSVSRKGDFYLKVAENSKGEIFDICELDWGPSFDKIAVELIDSVQSKYDVSKVIREIVSVKLDGVEIPADKYRFASKTITIDESLIAKNDMEIEVVYIPK